MNGRYVLDTNAVIALLNGNAGLLTLLNQAVWIGISVIVELEFLSFPKLSTHDAALFQQFKKRVEVIGIDAADANLMQEIILTRQQFNVKLPDAIIAALAIQQQSTLLTNDAIFKRVQNLNVQTF